MAEEITVLLVGNHDSLMKCVAARLERDPRLSLRGTVGLPHHSIERPEWQVSDLLIIDIDSAEGNCLQLATRIRSCWPKTHLILLASAFDDRCIAQALQIGVRALVSKDRLWQLIPVAIDEVLGGGVYFPEDVRSRIVIDSAGASLGIKLPKLPHARTSHDSGESYAMGYPG